MKTLHHFKEENSWLFSWTTIFAKEKKMKEEKGREKKREREKGGCLIFYT